MLLNATLCVLKQAICLRVVVISSLQSRLDVLSSGDDFIFIGICFGDAPGNGFQGNGIVGPEKQGNRIAFHATSIDSTMDGGLELVVCPSR